MKKIFSFLGAIAVLLLPFAASAAWTEICPGTGGSIGIPVPCLGNSAGPAGQYTITLFIISVIDLALWIVGLLSVLFVIVGGFRYVTAHGNEEQAEAAKKTITQAIIGIVVVILSFVVIRVIASALVTGTA